MARVKMIDRRTGTNFWVIEERVEEYKAAGHKLAASPSIATMPTDEPKKATRKVATKKATTKK